MNFPTPTEMIIKTHEDQRRRYLAAQEVRAEIERNAAILVEVTRRNAEYLDYMAARIAADESAPPVVSVPTDPLQSVQIATQQAGADLGCRRDRIDQLLDRMSEHDLIDVIAFLENFTATNLRTARMD